MRRTVMVAGVSALLALGTAWPASALPAAPPYANCDEARADGNEDIAIGSPGYRPALDRDRDGIACESGDGSGGGSGEGLPTGGSGEGAAESSGSDEDAQVSVVPQGAAPTGDGSMQTGADAAWWSVLVTLVAAGGAVLVGAGRGSVRS